MLKDKVNEVENKVHEIAKKMGAQILSSYRCYGKEKYPDSVSLYFDIAFCEARQVIRISDHTYQHKNQPNQKLKKSLTVFENVKMDAIERFVKNRVEELRRRAFWRAMNLITKNGCGVCAKPIFA